MFNSMINYLLIFAGLLLLAIGLFRLAQQGDRAEEERIQALTQQLTQQSAIIPRTPDPGTIASLEEIARQLQEEATRKALYIHIWNTAFYEGDEVQFSAIATLGKPINIYVEDGAGPYWSVHNCATATEAAWQLLQALRLAPNSQPQFIKHWAQSKDSRKRVAHPDTLTISPEK